MPESPEGGRGRALVAELRLGFDEGREEPALQQVLAHHLGAAGRQVVDGVRAARERGEERDLPVASGHEARQRVAEEVLDNEHRHRRDHRGHGGLERYEPADDRRHRLLMEALKHRRHRSVVDREPPAPALDDCGRRELLAPDPLRRLGGNGSTLRVLDDSFQKLGPRSCDEGVEDVARESTAKNGDGILGNFSRIVRRPLFSAAFFDAPDRREQRNRMGSAVLGLGRSEEPHLYVVPEHPSVQRNHSASEDLDVGVLFGVLLKVQMLRPFRDGRASVAAGRSVVTASRDDHCVPGSQTKVGTSLGRDGRDDVSQTVGNVLAGNATCPVDGFLEGAVAPDVLGERLGVVDVLEALADGVLAKPLTDRLRGMPAMHELRAGDPQLFSHAHGSVLAIAGVSLSVQATRIRRIVIAGSRDTVTGASLLLADFRGASSTIRG